MAGVRQIMLPVIGWWLCYLDRRLLPIHNRLASLLPRDNALRSKRYSSVWGGRFVSVLPIERSNRRMRRADQEGSLP